MAHTNVPPHGNCQAPADTLTLESQRVPRTLVSCVPTPHQWGQTRLIAYVSLRLHGMEYGVPEIRLATSCGGPSGCLLKRRAARRRAEMRGLDMPLKVG